MEIQPSIPGINEALMEAQDEMNREFGQEVLFAYDLGEGAA